MPWTHYHVRNHDGSKWFCQLIGAGPTEPSFAHHYSVGAGRFLELTVMGMHTEPVIFPLLSDSRRHTEPLTLCPGCSLAMLDPSATQIMNVWECELDYLSLTEPVWHADVRQAAPGCAQTPRPTRLAMTDYYGNEYDALYVCPKHLSALATAVAKSVILVPDPEPAVLGGRPLNHAMIIRPFRDYIPWTQPKRRPVHLSDY